MRACAILLLVLLATAPLPVRAASADATAWTVFATMTAPAPGPGAKAVTFETWASDDDIYGGTPHWPARGAKLLRQSLAAKAEDMAEHAAPAVDCQPKDGKAGNFPPGACIGEEVQHNRPVFDTIIANGLTTRAGLATFYDSAKSLSFPSDSIVVKADWVLVGDILRWLPQYKSASDVRRAYYTNTATLNRQSGEYALVGMSVQNKDRKDWLWATFEHRSNPGRCDLIGCVDSFGASNADVRPASKPNADYGPCAKTAALKVLFAARHIDPIWENYCLKGTQVAFLKGIWPTILANSVIERMNKGVPVLETSCITCHAYASFSAAGTPNYAVLPMHPRGAPQPALLKGFKQHDYLWGILAIQH